jgi:hypothetical protein
MAVAASGATVTPSDHVDTVVAGIVSDTAIGTVASGFSVTTQQAWTVLAGRLIDINLFLNRTGADITQTNSNIADTTCFTLDSAYWPTEIRNGCYGNGSMDGEFSISTAGVVTLRSASYTIVSGTNVRICAVYMRS